MKYRHVAALLSGHPWAITERKLEEIRATFAMLAGRDPETVARRQAGYDDEAGGPSRTRPKVGGVGVLPLYGILCPKANMITEYSGGTSLGTWTRDFRAFMADDAVGSIVMDIDSPGGITYGVQELWAEIFAARGVKKVVAQINPECGSAAYWLATAAQEIVITPSGQAGSIGVYTIHEDLTGAAEQAGVKMTLVSAGPNKVEQSPFAPLSDEARAYMQSMVDTEYGNFLRAVAKGRGRSTADVEKNFGGGRMMMSGAAKAAGLVDRVGTLDETITRLIGKKAGPGGGRAAVVLDGPLVAVDLGQMVEGVGMEGDSLKPDVPLTENPPVDPEPEPAPDSAPEPIQAGLSLEDRRRRLERLA